MKHFKLLAAALAAAATLAACEKEAQKPDEDPVISVSPESINASWEDQIFDVKVQANCSWTISKTDSEGNTIDWVKCDLAGGSGDKDFHVRVYANDTDAERKATVTIFCDDVKAFIDVTQGFNPNPDPGPEPPGPGPGPGPEPPEPEPAGLELFFDFTLDGLGWPTTKDYDWTQLKNCDSGCATDNGGTATDNPHRRAQVTYTLEGNDYDFTFADPDGAKAHNIYLSTGKGVYSGTLRYFGLPAIEGKKLVKVEMVQNASTKDPATFTRNVGVSKQVYAADFNVADIEYVPGGEPQNQVTNGETYVYELSGTEPGTIYWMTASTSASIIMSLRLFYEAPDSNGSL